MGLFGISKKELKEKIRVMHSEIENLRSALSPEQADIETLKKKIDFLQNTADDLNNEINNRNKKLSKLSLEIDKLDADIRKKKQYLTVDLEDAIAMEGYGVYKPSFVFANSDLYKDRLTEIRNVQKQCIKDGLACTGSNTWTVNGNAAKGRAMVNDMKKLLLRAFNVECDDIVEKIKISNFDKSIDRIYKISEQISKLGAIMDVSITQRYIKLKIEEVKLALDFQQKKQEEKERLKELKEQQREEARAQKEIEEERKKLEKEQNQYKQALAKLMAQISKNGEDEALLSKKAELEGQLGEIAKAIEDVDYRAANERAGYVYIISNVGSFGENVYKIGMTRRLNPQERIDELGDASVPFNFDVHALIFTEDAPKLENALHHAFESKKLNKINARREFFQVSLEEIKKEVRKNYDKTVEWIDVSEAEQYRQSVASVQDKTY